MRVGNGTDDAAQDAAAAVLVHGAGDAAAAADLVEQDSVRAGGRGRRQTSSRRKGRGRGRGEFPAREAGALFRARGKRGSGQTET
jgi:hypothetical protein